MISAFKNVAQICGYYRQEEVKPVKAGDGGEVLERFTRLSDKELEDLIGASAEHAAGGEGQPVQPVQPFLIHIKNLNSLFG